MHTSCHRVRNTGEGPSLYRLHRNDLYTVFYDGFIAGSGLDEGLVPVIVVKGDLYGLDFRMFV